MSNVVSGTLSIGSGSNYDIILSDTSGLSTIFNQNRLDIDLSVSGVHNGDVLYYDASTGRLGVNVTNPDATLHVVTDCVNDGLKIESETNCATGVKILFIHNSQTPPQSGGYPVTIDMAGRDYNYNLINYAQIKSRILDPLTQQTSGELIFTVDHTGINKEIFRSSIINTVLGGMNSPTGHFYDILGYNNLSSGLSYIVVGNNNRLVSNTGIIIGNNISANGNNILVFANNVQATGHKNILFAVDSNISGTSNVLVGTNIHNTGNNSIILGNNTTLDGDNFVGLVSLFDISGQSGIGFGINGQIIGDNNIYLGSNIRVIGSDDIAVGSNINLSGTRNIVYGNYSDVSGNNIISIGRDNNPQNINSGIYIGNDISLSNSAKSIIIGLGTQTTSGLSDSVLIGINNSTSNSAPNRLVLVGQNNTVSEINESLVVGNNNNLSGTIANNIIIGPRNNVPLNSNNNLVVGLLNNTSGVIVSTDGSIIGVDKKTAGMAMANTTVFGINNWVSNASGALIFGNKTRVSGLNNNNVGSYTNLNGTNIQNLGNSNFVLGSNNAVLGSNNDILGINSISFNTSSDRNQIFGSGNVVIGHNEVIVSGISIGFDNEIYGTNNIVYGRNNTIGHVRYPCRVSGSDVVVIGDINAFNGGDNILVALYSPASQLQPVFIRTILDGVDEGTNLPLGIIKENIGANFTTTLRVNSDIASNNTIEYYIKDTFDDIIHGQNPCDVCFADLFAGYSSGYVMAFQYGNDTTDLVANPRYGTNNIVLGSNNKYTHSSGITLGHSNNVSGVNHLVIGHGMSGYYNNTIQIGTNNLNKLLLDNNKIVFNTGEFQHSIYFNSSNPGIDDNDARAMRIDLSTNRIGINTTFPRSTLDVSGLLTTDRLRVTLTGIAGYALISDNTGEATWQFPVNLSGQNSGLIFKVGDKIGSGIRELIFNTGTRELVYLRADRTVEPDFNLDEGSLEERILIINQSGLYLNNPGSDYGYDFVIRGSGVQDPVNGDNSIYLFRTLVSNNAVRMHNITGVSGSLQRLSVSNGIIAPVNLTGTILRVNSTGNLTSQSFDRFSLLFTHSSFAATGNNSLRYYPDSQAITIGTTGEPPIQSNVGFVQGVNNTFSNIILGSRNGIDTVFNNAGAGNNRFIVVSSGNTVLKKGFQYDVNTGSLGIGVSSDASENNWKVSSASDTRYWFEAGRLVVDGKLRASALQLTPDGKNLPGQGAINKYLKIVDTAGNVGLDTLDLQYQFSGIHPMRVETSTQNQVVSIRLSTDNANGVALGAADNGRSIVWNGSKWVHNRGFRFPQPSDAGNTDDITGMEFGNALQLNACRNTHVYGGGGFASPGANGFEGMRGSTQTSRFYLRGRTITDNTSELTADWHKNISSPTPNINNTISLQFTDEDSLQAANDHNKNFVWNYTVNYSAIFNDGTPNGFDAVAGEVKGTILSYRRNDGERTTQKVGSDVITKRYTTNADYSTTNPIDVTLLTTGDNINLQRLGIIARGRPSRNGLWSVSVDINQVAVPSGLNFSNFDIV